MTDELLFSQKMVCMCSTAGTNMRRWHTNIIYSIIYTYTGAHSLCVWEWVGVREGERSSAARAPSPPLGAGVVAGSAVWVVAESIHTHVRVSLTSAPTSGRRRGVRAREWVTRNTVVFDGRAHVGGGGRLLLRDWVGRRRRPRFWPEGGGGGDRRRPDRLRSSSSLLSRARVCPHSSLQQLPQPSARELAFCRKKIKSAAHRLSLFLPRSPSLRLA